MTGPVEAPAARPCASCPYRRDVPSGVWDRAEYEKLPAYDRPTAEQPTGVFMCHQRDERLCAGWAGCHDMDEALAVRIALAVGTITIETARALARYVTDVPLWRSGKEARDHGLARIEDPDERARTLAGGIVAKQRRG